MDARVASPDMVTSPISGKRAAFVHIEVTEDGELLGDLIVGDLVRFACGSETRDIVVRRATVELAFLRGATVPLTRAIPELVPILRRSKHGGVFGVREHLVCQGDVVRIRGSERGPVVLELLGRLS